MAISYEIFDELGEKARAKKRLACVVIADV
jgi:hypothetical protein